MTKMWLILFILIIIAGALVLAWVRLRDRRYLHKLTREALGKNLQKEIEMEKKVFSDRKERFGKALERARKRVLKKS